METDLHSLVQSSKSLHADWYKLYTYQILCGLKCIHSAGVLHRDLVRLKPNPDALDFRANVSVIIEA